MPYSKMTRIGRLRPEGAFNSGVEVWQTNDNKGKLLVRKTFLPRDLPHHAAREADILQQLSHCKYIVRITGAHITPTSGHIFMECCTKGTLLNMLDEHIKKGQIIPEPFVWHVFYSLVQAVNYMLHGPRGDANWNWIYHRDLHLGNIFVTGRRHTGLDIVLGDFGSAISSRWRDDFRVDMQAPYFAIPENRMNDRSDIYQIGLVVVALCRLTTKPLVYVRPVDKWVPEKLAGEDYSGTLNRLVKTCLCVQPGQRISAKELLKTLDKEVNKYHRASSRDPMKLLKFPSVGLFGKQEW